MAVTFKLKYYLRASIEWLIYYERCFNFEGKLKFQSMSSFSLMLYRKRVIFIVLQMTSVLSRRLTGCFLYFNTIKTELVYESSTFILRFVSVGASVKHDSICQSILLHTSDEWLWKFRPFISSLVTIKEGWSGIYSYGYKIWKLIRQQRHLAVEPRKFRNAFPRSNLSVHNQNTLQMVIFPFKRTDECSANIIPFKTVSIPLVLISITSSFVWVNVKLSFQFSKIIQMFPISNLFVFNTSGMTDKRNLTKFNKVSQWNNSLALVTVNKCCWETNQLVFTVTRTL